jgi:amino acid adenylation domain-containing protein
MHFSVLSDLENSAAILGDKTAITCGELTLTFDELRSKAKATACALVEMGVKPGDRVGICMTKCPEQIVVILGVLYANAIFVPILPALKRRGIAHIISNSGMIAIVTDSKRLNEIAYFENKVKVFIGNGELTETYPNLPYITRHLETETLSPFCRLGIDVAAIIYSSGSTGMPKGIMVSHRNFFDGARITSEYLNTRQTDRIACILSFNFDYGLNQLWQSLFIGCSLYLHEFIMPNDCFNLLNKHQITALPLMPAIMTRLFDSRFVQLDHCYDLSCVRYVCSSGGRLSNSMLSNVRAFFPNALMYSMYGLTEAFRSTYLHPSHLQQRPGSIGKAIPDVEILVLDNLGNECAAGVEGELVHRGGCIALGYWNDVEGTNERFRTHPSYPGEKLVYSGDLVVRDHEGYISFVSRKDEMLKNNGMRISAAEIEVVFDGHPDVSAVVVFGVENIEVGHDIVAVYTTNNSEPLDQSTLKRFLKDSLASHMVPKYIVHQENFPATGNQGKIDRITVRRNAILQLGIDT